MPGDQSQFDPRERMAAGLGVPQSVIDELLEPHVDNQARDVALASLENLKQRIIDAQTKDTKTMINDYGPPNLSQNFDHDGNFAMLALSAGWDVSWGCRINFGTDFDGILGITVHISDGAKRDGVAQRNISPAELRLFAQQLEAVATAYEQLEKLR